jgi:hypothetical protein
VFDGLLRPSADPSGEYTVRAVSESDSIFFLEAGVVSECMGIRARNWSRAVEQTLPLPASGQAIPLELPAGRYGLVARTSGATCEVEAFACLDVEIVADGVADFVLVLQRELSASICASGELCTAGRCRPAPSPDAGTDVPTKPDTGPGDGCGPGDHLDCFGGRFCEDGVVYEYSNNPQPCGAWSCPFSELGACPAGCATDVVDYRTRRWTTLCEGTHIREEGDACLSDDECEPTAPQDGPRLYLACSTESSTCVPSEASTPPVGGACDTELLERESERNFRAQLTEDATCAGAFCLMSHSNPLLCIRSICTAECESDWDCPSDMRCGHARDLSLGRGDAAFEREGPYVCRAINYLDEFPPCEM